ncbi:MAG: hypothetical protein AB2421_02775 [Thermotaleaceae bacterium]
MKTVGVRIVKLFVGLFLFAVGIVMTINGNLGLAPWDTFHQGLANITGLTIGRVNIIVGSIIVLFNCLLGERIGWGTLSNMIFIGIFMDLLMLNNLIPIAQGLLSGLIMMCSGMFIIGIGSCFYMRAGFGSGPRDGLMVALTKKTHKPVGLVRSSIEIMVLFAGYLLGGTLGVGTLVAALGIGYFVQLAFKVLKFDVKSVHHRFIDEDIKELRRMLSKTVKSAEEN